MTTHVRPSRSYLLIFALLWALKQKNVPTRPVVRSFWRSVRIS